MANIYLWSPQCSRRKCIFIHHHTWKQVNLTNPFPKPAPKNCCLGPVYWDPKKLWKHLEKVGEDSLNLSRLFAVRPHPSSWPAPNKVTKSLFLEHVLIESWPWVSSQVRSHHTSVPKVRLTQGLFAQAPHTGGERSTDGGHSQWSSPRGAEDFY